MFATDVRVLGIKHIIINLQILSKVILQEERDMNKSRVINHYKTSRKKRRNAVLRKLSFTIITAVFVTIIALSVFSMSAKAKSTQGANDYKYYTSHMIMPGESLWSIAQENIDYVHYESVQAYIEEINFINGMTNSELQIGDYILIPYFSDEIK